MANPLMKSVPDQRASARWLPALDRADLMYLLLAVWLILKQRFTLSVMSIPPGPGMLIASTGAALFLSAWVRLWAGRWQIAVWMILNLFVSVVMYADKLYFHQFGDLASVASLRFSMQLGDVGSSVTHIMSRSDLWLIVDLLVLAPLLALPTSLSNRWFARARKWTVVGTALVGALIVTLVAIADPILSEKYYGHTMVGSRMGLINYHAFDLGAYAQRLAQRIGPKGGVARKVEDWFSANRPAIAVTGPTTGSTTGQPQAAPLTGTAKGKNVIMLQIESLQSFPIGMKIEGQEITPNLNRLMTESLTFPNFYHQTGQGVTSDADLLANCSLFPTRTGAIYYDYADNDFRCLPTLLREQGYAAVAMQGMPADFWNLAAVYPRVGFERYDSIRAYAFDEKVGIGLSDQSFLRQSVEKLKALPEPYYAFLVTLTSHHPFGFENLPRELNLGQLEGTMAADYLHVVHYTDKAIGQFLDRLEAEGILDRSLLVVYGDHQGVWRWDDGVKQLLAIPDENEAAWVQAEKKVPFMIRLPGGTRSGLMPEAAGQVDIAPTVAGLLGLPTDDAYLMGRDLLATGKGIVPFYRGSAASDTHLYLSPDDAGEGGACYDLSTGESVPVNSCEPLATQAAEQLEISRLLVERNLIPYLLRN